VGPTLVNALDRGPYPTTPNNKRGGRYLPKNERASNKTEGIDIDWTSDSALGGALQPH